MAGQDCVFCGIVSGQILSARVFDNSDVVAFLDINPISDGHTLVIPKDHFSQLHDCSSDVVLRIMTAVGPLARAVVTAVGADGYNLLCNSGRAAGQLVDHLHFHIIPRKSGDGVMAKWNHCKYSPGRADQIASEIRKQLDLFK